MTISGYVMAEVIFYSRFFGILNNHNYQHGRFFFRVFYFPVFLSTAAELSTPVDFCAVMAG